MLQQLYPSGVVGMVGTAEGRPILKPTGVTSYRELVSVFGGESGSLVRDAKLAFLNGVFQVCATRIEGTGGTHDRTPELSAPAKRGSTQEWGAADIERTTARSVTATSWVVTGPLLANFHDNRASTDNRCR